MSSLHEQAQELSHSESGQNGQEDPEHTSCILQNVPPTDTASYLQALGLACMAEERFDESYVHFSAAINSCLDSQKANLFSARSRISLCLRNIAGAIEDAFQCTQQYPDFVGGYVHLSEACLSIGDREQARTSSLQGKVLDPANSEVNRMLLRASETKQSNSIPMLFLQQLVCSSGHDRSSLLHNWDTKIKEEMYETILEDWNAIIFYLISPFAEHVMSITRFALLKEVLNVEPNSSDDIVSEVCQACFNFDGAINRTLLLQIAIAGWRQIIPRPSDQQLVSVAGFNLCLGFAHLQVKAVSRTANIEKAIASFQRALAALDPVNFAEPWAAAHQGLGEAYKHRKSGNKDENLVQAIEHFKHVISVHTSEIFPLRHAFIQYEIAQLYTCILSMKQCLEHVDLSTKSLDPSRNPGERQLKATVHRFAADMLVNAAKKHFEEQKANRSETEINENLSSAIRHFQAVLELYSVHEYPITTLSIKIKIARLKMWRSNLSTFEQGGLVCFFTHEDRRNLITAHQEFLEALAGAEACAMVFHGYDKMAIPAVWIEIQNLLFTCFSGCIETSIRLGNYAQAMAYSERSRVHDVLELGLASASRPWLLQSMQPDDVAEFLRLRSKLDQYAQLLEKCARFEREGEISFAPDARLRGMLRDAAKLIMLVSDQGAHTGGKKMRLLQLNMPPIMDVGPSIWKQATTREHEEAIVEWYIGTARAHVFIISDKDVSPKTIEYTSEQKKAILNATNSFYSATCALGSFGSFDASDADRIQSALAAVSDALRLDAILAAIPAHCKRLIVVPHGTLCSMPFSALPYGPARSRSDSFTNLKYLADRFTLGIVCVPSMSLLQWSEDRVSQMRFAPILQGLALNKHNTKKNLDGKENARSDAEFACLKKTLSKLTVEHQVH